jgi:hypothetical protein
MQNIMAAQGVLRSGVAQLCVAWETVALFGTWPTWWPAGRFTERLAPCGHA